MRVDKSIFPSTFTFGANFDSLFRVNIFGPPSDSAVASCCGASCWGHHSLVRPAWEPHASADSERLEQQVSAEHSQPAWQLAELQMACAVQVELEQLAGPELLIGQEQLACSAQVLPSYVLQLPQASFLQEPQLLVVLQQVSAEQFPLVSAESSVRLPPVYSPREQASLQVLVQA